MTEHSSARNPADKIIFNYLITSGIFKELSNQDLLNLCRVSKAWNSSARDYIRSHRQCPIIFNQLQNPEKLRDLLEILENPHTKLPFNGVHFIFASPQGDFFKNTRPMRNNSYVFSRSQEDLSGAEYEWSLEEVLLLVEQVFQHFHENNPMKYVIMEYGKEYRSDFGNFAKYFSLLPLELIVSFSTNVPLRVFVGELQQREFSNLETFHMQHDTYKRATKDPADRLKTLLKACPNIANWPGDVAYWSLSAFKSTDKMFLVKNIRLSNITPITQVYIAMIKFAEITKLVVESIKPQNRDSYYPDFVQVIRSNIDSLQIFHTDVTFLEYIISSDLPPFVNVVDLKIFQKCESISPEVIRHHFPQAKLTPWI